MRSALVNVISPGVSRNTEQALAQGKKRRKRVQKQLGECMTEDEAMKRLRVEEEERKNKKTKTSNVTKTGKKTKGQPSKCSKKLYSHRARNESSYESSSLEDLPELNCSTNQGETATEGLTADKEEEEPLKPVKGHGSVSDGRKG